MDGGLSDIHTTSPAGRDPSGKARLLRQFEQDKFIETNFLFIAESHNRNCVWTVDSASYIPRILQAETRLGKKLYNLADCNVRRAFSFQKIHLCK